MPAVGKMGNSNRLTTKERAANTAIKARRLAENIFLTRSFAVGAGDIETAGVSGSGIFFTDIEKHSFEKYFK